MHFSWLYNLRAYFFPKRTTTIRFTFSWLFLAIASAGVAIALQSGSGNRVILTVPTSVQAIGVSYPVDVYVYTEKPVNAVTLEIEIPDNVVVESIDRGESVITLWTKDPVVTNGVAYLEGGTYRRGFIGKHKIATLQVKATSAKEAIFNLKKVSLLAGDGKGTEIGKTEVGLVTAVVKHSEKTADTLLTGTKFDVTGDGKVSLADMSAFLVAWSTKNQVYDFNNDGKMTFSDFSILLSTLTKS